MNLDQGALTFLVASGTAGTLAVIVMLVIFLAVRSSRRRG
jgi:hypothetical protein